MSTRKVSFIEGEYYHIYNRGNSKQTIFHDKQDYNRFMKLLFLSNGKENFKIDYIGNKNIYDFERGDNLVAIGSYCLMPNHFHLLLTQKIDGGISKFMQKITTAYSMYYNKKYIRTGSLFEGKFKSIHIEEDRYLKYLFSYIHLNPVKLINKNWKKEIIKNKKNIIDFLEQYKYSSYLDYLKEERIEKIILESKSFPKYFLTKDSIKKEVFEWLSYNDKI
ncbi:MAG: transposase [Candidatus Nomurabacteria bacterium]|nr:transposase [Candidatus Nomurabacteria bacterium]